MRTRGGGSTITHRGLLLVVAYVTVAVLLGVHIEILQWQVADRVLLMNMEHQLDSLYENFLQHQRYPNNNINKNNNNNNNNNGIVLHHRRSVGSKQYFQQQQPEQQESIEGQQQQ